MDTSILTDAYTALGTDFGTILAGGLALTIVVAKGKVAISWVKGMMSAAK